MAEHTHKCGFAPPSPWFIEDEGDHGTGCGHEFSHDRNAIYNKEDFDNANEHRCPNCGKGPWYTKYYDPEFPEGERYHPDADRTG